MELYREGLVRETTVEVQGTCLLGLQYSNRDFLTLYLVCTDLP